MFKRMRLIRVVFAALIASGPACQAVPQEAEWRKANAEWRETYQKDLLKPDGWLSLAGLEWLEAGDNTVGASSDNRIRLGTGPAHLMVLHLEAEAVTLQPPPGGFSKDLMVNGEPAKVQPLTAEGNKDKLSPHITIGTLNVYVIRREKRFALRIKDSQSAGITGFHGLKWFVADPSYRVTAKWIPYLPAKKLMLTTLVGTSYEQPVPGAAEFVLKGKIYRIEPVVEDPVVPKLFFILRDTTSKSSTYGACRFLYTGFPTNGVEKPGELVLDFNRLENPPCAYTPYSTCPLPPPGNRLPIALPVGEKRYHE
jgi:uncharacterized protein